MEITPLNRLRLDDLDAIADAETVDWLPYWLVRGRIQVGRLVSFFPDQPGFLYDAHALWTQTLHLLLKVRLAVDALATALPKLIT